MSQHTRKKSTTSLRHIFTAIRGVSLECDALPAQCPHPWALREALNRMPNLYLRRTFCAEYKVRFASFTGKSYVLHECDPLKKCMIFQLDYDRKSDVSDQVGYWWVEPLSKDRSRVFYAAITTVPAWVPKICHGAIFDIVAKRSTAWVDVESRKEWAARRSERTPKHLDLARRASSKFSERLAAFSRSRRGD